VAFAVKNEINIPDSLHGSTVEQCADERDEERGPQDEKEAPDGNAEACGGNGDAVDADASGGLDQGKRANVHENPDDVELHGAL